MSEKPTHYFKEPDIAGTKDVLAVLNSCNGVELMIADREDRSYPEPVCVMIRWDVALRLGEWLVRQATAVKVNHEWSGDPGEWWEEQS